MRKISGDIWEQDNADAVCIPTNGSVKFNKENVMGAGLALQAKQKFPGIELEIGASILNNGNHVSYFKVPNVSYGLISFPTKVEWFMKSQVLLIEKSCKELVKLVDSLGLRNIGLPKVGCGCGGLEWAVVQPVLKVQLDNRFFVVV